MRTSDSESNKKRNTEHLLKLAKEQKQKKIITLKHNHVFPKKNKKKAIPNFQEIY